MRRIKEEKIKESFNLRLDENMVNILVSAMKFYISWGGHQKDGYSDDEANFTQNRVESIAI